MGEESRTPKEENAKKDIAYEILQNPAFLEEQPFYYKGMCMQDCQAELAYLNQNLSSFYDGSYVPLWKQTWIQ